MAESLSKKRKEAFPLPIDNTYPLFLIQANDWMNELYATKLAGEDVFSCAKLSLVGHCIHFLIKKLYHGKRGRAYLMPYGDKLTRQYQLIYWNLFECIERIVSAGILTLQNGHTPLSVWYLTLIEGVYFRGFELALPKDCQEENNWAKRLALPPPFTDSKYSLSESLDRVFQCYASQNNAFRQKYLDLVTAREASHLLAKTISR